MIDAPPTVLGPQGLPYRPCAGVVLVNPAGLVFAGQRIDNPGDAWQMPQGGIDAGETPAAAALRELGEETGIAPGLVEIAAQTPGWIHYDLPADLRGRLWQGRYGGQVQKWFLMRFRGADADIDIATAHPEFSRWAWLPAAEVEARIVPFKRAVYRRILGDFSRWLA